MVMRNRNDGADVRRWWDDLPRVRGRVPPPDAPPAPADAEPCPVVSTRELARDLSALALLFSAVAVANLLFLLVALSFVAGR